MRPIINLDHVSFTFPNTATPLFDNLSLAFAPCMLHRIVGDNGSGKSTLMRLLVGQIYPQEQVTGRIVRNGTIRLVVQRYDHMLAPSFSVEQNLAFALLERYPSPFRRLSTKFTPEIAELLHSFAIPTQIPVGKLSGGQRQMLVIALALAQPTDVLLLDEPTAAFDIHHAAKLFSFLQYLIDTQGLTIIVICHQREYQQLNQLGSCVQIISTPESYTRTVVQTIFTQTG